MPSNSESDPIAVGNYLRLCRSRGWEFVERIHGSGVVAIVAITDAGELVLVEQYRPPVDACVIELPAGIAGDLVGQEDEALEEAARRELLEETGYTCATMERVTTGPPSAGATTEMLTLFVATGLQKVAAGGGDSTEDITIHEVPVGTALVWLKEQESSGRAIDPKVYGGLYFGACREL